jgi:hypothetical protein
VCRTSQTGSGGGRSISELRLPDRLTASLRVTVSVLPERVGVGRLRMIADIFNVFDHSY